MSLVAQWLKKKKKPACQCKSFDMDLTPGSGMRLMFPWRKWKPVFLPGKSHGQRSLASYNPWGLKRDGHDLETKQQQETMSGRISICRECKTPWRHLQQPLHWLFRFRDFWANIMSGSEQRFRRLCQPMIVFSTPIGEHDLCFPTIIFSCFFGVGWWHGWGGGSFTTFEEGNSGPTIVSTCLVDSSTATTSSPHLNGGWNHWCSVNDGLSFSCCFFLKTSLCHKGRSDSRGFIL